MMAFLLPVFDVAGQPEETQLAAFAAGQPVTCVTLWIFDRAESCQWFPGFKVWRRRPDPRDSTPTVPDVGLTDYWLQWLVTTVTTVTSNKSDIWLLTFVLTRLFDLVKLRDWIESFHAMLELRDKDRQPSSPESSAMATPPTRPPLVPSQETCFFFHQGD